MSKALSVVFLLALAGCAGVRHVEYAASPCTVNPGGYDCQVEQYMNAP